MPYVCNEGLYAISPYTCAYTCHRHALRHALTQLQENESLTCIIHMQPLTCVIHMQPCACISTRMRVHTYRRVLHTLPEGVIYKRVYHPYVQIRRGIHKTVYHTYIRVSHTPQRLSFTRQCIMNAQTLSHECSQIEMRVNIHTQQSAVDALCLHILPHECFSHMSVTVHQRVNYT